MKRFFKQLAVLASFLGASCILDAQNPDSDGYLMSSYNDDITLGTRKYLSSTAPNANGEYILRLESFLMKELGFTPTDIVLVLDGSGSMRYNYIDRNQSALVKDLYDGQYKPIDECEVISLADGDRYLKSTSNDYFKYPGFTRLYHEKGTTPVSSEPNQSTSWPLYPGSGQVWVDSFRNYGETPGEMTRFYRYDWGGTWEPYQGYYKIFHKENSSGKYLYIRRIQTKTGVTNQTPTERVLWNNDCQDVAPYRVTTNASTIYNVQMDKIYRPQTRKEAMIDGVKAFIQTIADRNAMTGFWPSGVTKNQIAIVGFGNGYSGGTASITPYTGSTPTDYTKVIKSFTVADYTLANNSKNLLESTMAYLADTHTHRGVELAKLLLADLQSQNGMAPITSSGDVNREKVVVVFTDGYPDVSGSSFYAIVNSALQYAYDIKKTGWNSGNNQPELNAKIYAIDLSHDAYARMFLQHLSSDYPEGLATISSGGRDADPSHYSGTQVTVDKYYHDAGESDLMTIFESIASESMGSIEDRSFTSALAAVDKIASPFLLPSNVTTSGRVKLYTAPYLGETNGHLTFGSETLAPSRGSITLSDVSSSGATTSQSLDIDNGISFSVLDSRTISITGFDYGTLWCGTLPTTGTARGYKLIAEVPVKVPDEFIGGYNLSTNQASSGLYLSSKVAADGTLTESALAPYVSPTLSIPIKLIIQKTGLKPGESASFTIQRKSATSSGSTYVDFASFILTGDSEETPEVRFLNLDPTYHYRIKETGWSWSYSSDAMTDFPSTEDQTLTNPIVISNSPLAIPVNRAEAKATNVLKTN